MKIVLPFLTGILLLVCSCNNSEEIKAKADEPETKAEAPAKRIKNNIKLETKGVVVSQAFLLYENGQLVPDNNETAVGEPLNLRLVVDKGWTEKEGNVSLGASERIETPDGKLVLDEKDLFENTPIDADAAHLLTLTAVISRLGRLYDYFLVRFHVWDKNGSGEINGSYKLFIKGSSS